ncbi:alpha/beta fold hydrolase [Alkalicoccobacillus murimartini]|uniref:Proline iminopeptidase n=1 Tax=Alkalicoccobacillus murimartini TaxID=171685 RepID=A0ABT9YIE7_9BACI|nr:alpha/beta hydrolase [Alkalicoccobacillus murimartini]MDQ0207637.1 proline iminopeptidase [Alkalicoccobacillus murimartini]
MWRKQIIETDNGRFEVFVQGNGKPLCITHLYSEFDERGNYFADHFVPFFTVYLVNLREAGNSEKADHDDQLSMGQSVRDLEAIRKALEIETWSFAGHSTGGMLALVYAADYPESLEKMVVSAAALSYEYMQHPDSIYCKENEYNKRILELMQTLHSPTATLEERRATGREWIEMSLYRPENYDQYFVKPSSGKVVPKRLNYFSYQELPTYNLSDKVNQITVPAIICCGRHDSQCPLDCSISIQKLLVHSTFVVFEESNHSPFLEESTAFSKMVEQFTKLEENVV